MRILNLELAKQRPYKSIATIGVAKHGKSRFILTAPGLVDVFTPDEDVDTYLTHVNRDRLGELNIWDAKKDNWDAVLSWIDRLKERKKQGVKTVAIDTLDGLIYRLFQAEVDRKDEGDKYKIMNWFQLNTKHITRLLNLSRDLNMHFICAIHADPPEDSAFSKDDDRGVGMALLGRAIRNMAPGLFDMVCVVERKVMGNNLVYKVRTKPISDTEPVGHRYGPDAFKKEEEPDATALIKKMLAAQGYVYPVKGGEQDGR